MKRNADDVQERRADHILPHRPDEEHPGPAGKEQQQDDASDASQRRK
jgi:hypothetical protein